MPWHKETFLHALKGVGAYAWFWAQIGRSMESAPGQAEPCGLTSYSSSTAPPSPPPACPPPPQHFLKEINPEYSLGGLMLKLKLQ